jgi:hypothetical protein
MHIRLAAIRLLLSAFATLLAAGGATEAANLPSQSTSQAGVTVRATPRNLSGGAWEFEVVFDTHSQDLKDDLVKSAKLVGDGGASYAPTAWQGDPPGGHHREGVLRFKPIAPQPQAIELRIQRAGEPAVRSFRWRLQ